MRKNQVVDEKLRNNPDLVGLRGRGAQEALRRVHDAAKELALKARLAQIRGAEVQEMLEKGLVPNVYFEVDFKALAEKLQDEAQFLVALGFNLDQVAWAAKGERDEYDLMEDFGLDRNN